MMFLLTTGIAVLLQAQPFVAPPGAADLDLIEAARSGQVAQATALLEKGANVNAIDRRGFTPVMWASASGDAPMVRHLIERGALLNARSNDGSTALRLASANGFVEVARLLLIRGADIAPSKNGTSARQIAAARGHAEVETLLAQAEDLGARLLKAAAEGHDTLARQLLAAGAPASITDERGATPLMLAARNGDLGLLQALLSRGADASARDAQGQTVLQWAEPSPTTGKYVIAFLRDRGITGEAAIQRAAAPAPQVKASLDALATLLGRVPPAPASSAALRRATTALTQLRALSAAWPADSPADYRDNLAGHVRRLQTALTAADARTLTATLDAVAEDLEIKLEHCVMSGGKLGAPVAVKVRTVREGQEVRSWQVFYLPRVLETAPGARPDLFPQLSSPTEELLVPGRYVMWVRDPTTTRTGERTIVKVGGGRKDLLLDLPLPSSPAR